MAVGEAFEAGSFGVDEVEFKVFAVVAVCAKKNPFFGGMPEGSPMDARLESQLADVCELVVLESGDEDLRVAFGVKRAPCDGFSARRQKRPTIVAFAPSEAALVCTVCIHHVQFLVAVAVGAKEDVLSVGAVGSFGVITVGMGQATGVFAVEICAIDLVRFVDPCVLSFVLGAGRFAPFLRFGGLFALCAVFGDPRWRKKTKSMRLFYFIDGRGVQNTLSVWMKIRTSIVSIVVCDTCFFSCLEVKQVDLCMGMFFPSIGLKDQLFSIR